jgi:hypothetical protein
MDILIDAQKNIPNELLRKIYLKNISPCKYCGDVFDTDRNEYWDFCDLGCKINYMNKKYDNQLCGLKRLPDIIISQDIQPVKKYVSKKIHFVNPSNEDEVKVLVYEFSYIINTYWDDVDIKLIIKNANTNYIYTEFKIEIGDFKLYQYDTKYILTLDNEEFIDELECNNDVRLITIDNIWEDISKYELR